MGDKRLGQPGGKGRSGIAERDTWKIVGYIL
jgi:hypothetical protein